MEYLEGKDLSDWLAGSTVRSPSSRRSTSSCRPEAIAEAHALGIDRPPAFEYAVRTMRFTAARFLLAAAVAALVSLLGRSASAQTMKVAVVDVQRAVMQTEDGLRAQATLKKLFDSRQQELNKRQQELGRQKEEIDKQSKVLSQAALQKKVDDWQKQMVELQTTFVEYNKELEKKQKELTDPIFERVVGAIKRIAGTDGYDLIVDRATVAWRSDLDLTDRVIQLANGGSAAPAPAPSGGAKGPSLMPAPLRQAVRPGISLRGDRLQALAARHGGKVVGDGSKAPLRLAPVATASEGDFSALAGVEVREGGARGGRPGSVAARGGVARGGGRGCGCVLGAPVRDVGDGRGAGRGAGRGRGGGDRSRLLGRPDGGARSAGRPGGAGEGGTGGRRRAPRVRLGHGGGRRGAPGTAARRRRRRGRREHRPPLHHRRRDARAHPPPPRRKARRPRPRRPQRRHRRGLHHRRAVRLRRLRDPRAGRARRRPGRRRRPRAHRRWSAHRRRQRGHRRCTGGGGRGRIPGRAAGAVAARSREALPFYERSARGRPTGPERGEEATDDDRDRSHPADPAAPVAVRDGRPGDGRGPEGAHRRPQVRDHGGALGPGALPGTPHHARRSHHRGIGADRRPPRLRQRALRRFELAHVFPRDRQGEVPAPRVARRQARPPPCRILHHRTNVWKFRGEASVDGTLCASAEFLASVVDRNGCLERMSPC